jgi:glutathione S-transferase
MKLYICWGTFPVPGGHSCRRAYKALEEAGHDFEVVKAYGARLLPDFLNRTEGRQEAKRLTGKTTVPVLVTDDGEVVSESRNIARWAKENPARPPSPSPTS